MSEEFKRFGRYLILDHLVDGGMAKICRARHLGEQANKIVAIKMVQPQFSKDPAFRVMFEDELKVTFGLIHPNIAQTYDYGTADGQLYTAIEYVDGRNVKQYIEVLKKHKKVFPAEIATHIISMVCQALHYVHTYTDKLSGKPLNIIHRDISPHNIMVSFDGAVKVIDFGIAKAATNTEATQVGTIKGKLSYLAPECLEGLELDHRYDQFTVGITFYEMLTGRKLFSAPNDVAVLKEIQKCQVHPPSEIVPSIPKELDEILLKALSKDRNLRFENMDKFNRALVKFLYSHYPEFNGADVAGFAHLLFKEEIEKDRVKFKQFGQIDITPYLDSDSETAAGGTLKGNITDNKRTNRESRTQVFELDPGLKNKQKQNSPKLEITTEVPARRKQQFAGTGSIKANLNPQGGRSNPTRTRVSLSKIDTEEPTARKWIPLVIIMIMLLLGYYFYSHKNTSRAEQEEIMIEEDQMTQATLILDGFDPFMDLEIDGQKRSYSNLGIEVPLKKAFKIVISRPGYKTFQDTITIENDDQPHTIQVPSLEKIKTGLFSTSRNYPAGAKLSINVDGDVLEKKLPITSLELPVGEYTGTVFLPDLGVEKKIQFVIEENRKTTLDEN